MSIQRHSSPLTQFSGSLVALVTPMKPNPVPEAYPNALIDAAALRHLVDIQVTQGTQALVVNGTTGEAPTLQTEEQLEVLQIVLDEVCGRLPVIAGTGACSTEESILKTQQAMALGADACLVITPYFNRPTQEGLYRHYAAVANNAQAPIILYNNPARTGVDLLPETVLRLSQIPGILGIKEAAADAVARILSFRQHLPSSFLLYAGNDDQALEAIQAGASGVISAVANVVPDRVRQYVEAALKGNFYEANAQFRKLLPLIRALFIESNPIAIKWALAELKWIDSGIRLPLTPLSLEKQSLVRGALEDMLCL